MGGNPSNKLRQVCDCPKKGRANQLSRSSKRAKLTDSLKLKTLGESLLGEKPTQTSARERQTHLHSPTRGGALTFNEMQDQKTLQLIVSGTRSFGGRCISAPNALGEVTLVTKWVQSVIS